MFTRMVVVRGSFAPLTEPEIPKLGVAEARARILRDIQPLPGEWVGLHRAFGRVLAEDVLARRAQPPAAVSAMDGYAVAAVDTELTEPVLTVVGENRAGATSVSRLERRQAARIFTGARVPEGADAVALEENAVVEGPTVRFSRASRPGEFVRPGGLDFAAGERLLPAGTRLGARPLGLAAAGGHAWFAVRRQARVGIMSTGDELVWPGETAGPDQIPSSNAVTLANLVRGWGGVPVDLGIARDTEASLLSTLPHASGLDLVLTVGGVSVGQYDLVRPTLAKLGLELEFWRLAMRPGKPMMFGRLGDTPLLGLPGNAVSAAVCATLFVRAIMMTFLGLPSDLPVLRARTSKELPRNDEREDYLRAFRVTGPDEGWWLEAAGRQDSSVMSALAGADALLVRPPRAGPAPVGSTVNAIPLAEAETFGFQGHFPSAERGVSLNGSLTVTEELK